MRWLIGKESQAELGADGGRGFRRETAWCWALEPRLPITGEIHHAVIVDGVWIDSWCLLIAQSSTGTVIAWQWCARESTAAWQALFEQLPAPAVVVCDGGTGIRSALANVWPDTNIQRCIFHLQLNVTRELTRNPRLPAGRALREISQSLGNVRTVEQAIQWRLSLEAWWQAYGHMTRERSMYDNGRIGFTHVKLRKAWGILHRAADAGHIFTFLAHDNDLAHDKPQDLEIPALYDTGLDANEGLWLRTGWAGRG